MMFVEEFPLRGIEVETTNSLGPAMTPKEPEDLWGRRPWSLLSRPQIPKSWRTTNRSLAASYPFENVEKPTKSIHFNRHFTSIPARITTVLVIILPVESGLNHDIWLCSSAFPNFPWPVPMASSTIQSPPKKKNLDLAGLNFSGWWFQPTPLEKYDFVSWDDEIPNIESHKIRSEPPSFGCSWMSQKRPTELITVVPHFTIFTMQRPKWNSGRGFFKPADQLPTGLGCRFVVQKPFSWERDFPFTSIILNCITNQSFPGVWTSLMWHNNCWKKIIPQRVMHDQIPLIFWSKHQLVVGSERVAVGSWIHGVNFLAKTPQSTGKNDRHHSSTWGVSEAFFCLDLPSVISWQHKLLPCWTILDACFPGLHRNCSRLIPHPEKNPMAFPHLPELNYVGWWFQPTLLKNDGVRQLGWFIIPYGKIIQPVIKIIQPVIK